MSYQHTYAEITIAALTGEVSATCTLEQGSRHPASVSGIWPFEKALQDLAEGGYVIDLRPLAEHPSIYHWVVAAPMPSGEIEGDEVDALSVKMRRSAADMANYMSGDFQALAYLMATSYADEKAGPGPFDSVSSQGRAAWWGARGARIGRRIGQILRWNDGEEQEIPVQEVA